MGKLQVARYENQQEKVKVIMVGRAALTDGERAQLETDLNRIYGSSQTHWEVTVDSYPATDWDTDRNGLNAGDNASLSQYTSEMNALKRGYFQLHSQESNTYYVFVVAGFSPSSVQGYMPRGRGLGFISSGGDVAHTLAHELGHGAFGLEHTFDEVPQGSTDDLMDYASGSRLTHWQWQQIQHPGIIISWFDDPQDAEYETDGHYSTVYLTSLMLGLDPALAKELATYTEQPDTYVHSEVDFQLNDTWMNGSQQTKTHALTAGFHGTEEMLTALTFLATSKDNKQELGRLLHRYGDTYAHTRLDNATNPIKADDFEPEDKLAVYLKAWEGVTSEKLDAKLRDPWLDYVNFQVMKQHGFNFFTDIELQKKAFEGKSLMEYLNQLYGTKSSDYFEMYGKPSTQVKVFGYKIYRFTQEHFAVDKGLPDYIWVRPDWYLSYVKNLSSLLAFKYDLDQSKLDINTFNKMTAFAKANQCSLKGIIDYEISKKLNRNYVDVPVFYATIDHLPATVDATWVSNYQKIALDVVNNTKSYLQSEYGITNIEVKKIERLINGKEPFITTAAYKIIIK